MIRSYRMLLGMFFLLSLAGCEFVAGVFEAGFWVGAVVVVLIVAVLVWGLSAVRGRSRGPRP